jgi:hypothetical protein
MGFIIIKRGEKKPKKSYGRNIKKGKGTQKTLVKTIMVSTTTKRRQKEPKNLRWVL